MYRYFIFLLLACAIGAEAQKKREIFELESYRHTLNFTDHKLVFQALPSNGVTLSAVANNKYYWFTGREVRATQGGYSGKLLHGLYTDYYLNQSLKEQGTFNLGLKEGTWKAWTEEGVLISEVHYRAGHAEGKFMLYDQQGKLREIGNYRNGKVHGAIRKYLSPDSVVTEKYRHGVPKQKNKPWFKKLFKKRANAQGAKP